MVQQNTKDFEQNTDHIRLKNKDILSRIWPLIGS